MNFPSLFFSLFLLRPADIPFQNHIDFRPFDKTSKEIEQFDWMIFFSLLQKQQHCGLVIIRNHVLLSIWIKLCWTSIAPQSRLEHANQRITQIGRTFKSFWYQHIAINSVRARFTFLGGHGCGAIQLNHTYGCRPRISWILENKTGNSFKYGKSIENPIEHCS